MEIYLVGGAIRDSLLGLPVRERDWVVIGATPAEMMDLGYTPVGREFPVFLHPETKEEYALARTERKTGPGYTGFDVSASPDITLEEDLLRRDLTINAMAETPAGDLIDPYGGKDDLAKRVLRHVSPAFSEDPVRVLRIARFAARFAHAGFHVADATNALMRTMVRAGEINHLVPERVWAELVKTLETDNPARFFAILAACDALSVLFSELIPLASNCEDSQHGHSNIELPVLDQAVALGGDTPICFAALVCDIDNGTPAGFSATALGAFCQRLTVPNTCNELAMMSLLQRKHVHAATTLTAAGLLKLLNTLDAFRREARCNDFLKVCAADARASRRDFNGPFLLKVLAAARSVNTDELSQQGLSGREIGEALAKLRTRAIEKIRQTMAG